MERTAFEATCAAEGFGDVEQKDGPAGFSSKPHTHPFHVRGLVLKGDFSLTRGGATTTYRAGETFSLEAGCEHAESFGSGGATYVVARKSDGAGA